MAAATPQPTAVGDLVATTTLIAGGETGVHAPDLDLLAAAGVDGAFWQHGDDGLAGCGVALRIELPDGLSAPEAAAGVGRVLASIPSHDRLDRAGTGPVAIGALPFAPGAPGALVVPQVVIGRRGDDAWMTVVAPAAAFGLDGGSLELADEMRRRAMLGGTEPGRAPSEFLLTSVMDHDDWKGIVADAVESIDGGTLGKVVLARRVDVKANRPFVTSDVLSRLLALYPTCMVFRVDGFLGASPELLIERMGAHVASLPLAGTIPRSGDIASDEALIAGLLASAKERREHAYVIEALQDALAPICEELDVPDKPSVLELRNVSHLATHITGVLTATAAAAPGSPTHPRLSVPSALELVARVHPTPAVGGIPAADAVAYIQEVEGFDRGRYAGPVGWMDARGDGTWAIGIRSADVDGSGASMYAGVGLVAGSEPRAELVETQLKLQALLAALVRP
jgi:menaquinone-specific isochorismate synthase